MSGFIVFSDKKVKNEISSSFGLTNSLMNCSLLLSEVPEPIFR